MKKESTIRYQLFQLRKLSIKVTEQTTELLRIQKVTVDKIKLIKGEN